MWPAGPAASRGPLRDRAGARRGAHLRGASAHEVFVRRRMRPKRAPLQLLPDAALRAPTASLRRPCSGVLHEPLVRGALAVLDSDVQEISMAHFRLVELRISAEEEAQALVELVRNGTSVRDHLASRHRQGRGLAKDELYERLLCEGDPPRGASRCQGAAALPSAPKCPLRDPLPGFHTDRLCDDAAVVAHLAERQAQGRPRRRALNKHLLRPGGVLLGEHAAEALSFRAV
mmetsp:Transcript_30668/g.88952  ORF Transcript_30668/g.88952 Transcript_30668/m.88952 type:complete len:231 (-) Transcript_30668:1766-2458(-)